MVIDKHRDTVFELKKKLPNMPIFVMELWIRNSLAVGNKGDISILLHNMWADELRGGFDWERSFEGYTFWNMAINSCISVSRLTGLKTETEEYLDFQHFF
jgi:hypothetical protein